MRRSRLRQQNRTSILRVLSAEYSAIRARRNQGFHRTGTAADGAPEGNSRGKKTTSPFEIASTLCFGVGDRPSGADNFSTLLGCAPVLLVLSSLREAIQISPALGAADADIGRQAGRQAVAEAQSSSTRTRPDRLLRLLSASGLREAVTTSTDALAAFGWCQLGSVGSPNCEKRSAPGSVGNRIVRSASPLIQLRWWIFASSASTRPPNHSSPLATALASRCASLSLSTCLSTTTSCFGGGGWRCHWCAIDTPLSRLRLALPPPFTAPHVFHFHHTTPQLWPSQEANNVASPRSRISFLCALLPRSQFLLLSCALLASDPVLVLPRFRPFQIFWPLLKQLR